jgi:hypothetical protein
MPRSLSVLAFCLTLIPSCQQAAADFVTGDILYRPLASIAGVGDTQTVTFTPPPGSQIFPPAFQTGSFLAFGPGSTFAMNPTGSAIPWQDFFGNVATGLSGQPSGGFASWSFDAIGQSTNNHTADKFEIIGYGNLTMTGFEPTLTHYWLVWDRPETDFHFPPPPSVIQFALDATGLPAVPIPGPVVGAGLPGLILLLLVFWQTSGGKLRSWRRKHVTA